MRRLCFTLRSVDSYLLVEHGAQCPEHFPADGETRKSSRCTSCPRTKTVGNEPNYTSLYNFTSQPRSFITDNLAPPGIRIARCGGFGSPSICETVTIPPRLNYAVRKQRKMKRKSNHRSQAADVV